MYIYVALYKQKKPQQPRTNSLHNLKTKSNVGHTTRAPVQERRLGDIDEITTFSKINGSQMERKVPTRNGKMFQEYRMG